MALQILVRSPLALQVVALRARIILKASDPGVYSERRDTHPESSVRYLLDDAPRTGRPLTYGPG